MPTGLQELLNKRRMAEAREWAVLAHGTQRYGKKPYAYHLDRVVLNLARFGHLEEDLLIAGFLHDAVEDTGRTVAAVRRAFGDRAAELVDAVTDGDGANRGERKARPYRLIPTVPGALLLKLADRLANVEDGVKEEQDRLLRMYRREHPDFEEKLRGPREAEPMFEAISVVLFGGQ